MRSRRDPRIVELRRQMIVVVVLSDVSGSVLGCGARSLGGQRLLQPALATVSAE